MNDEAGTKPTTSVRAIEHGSGRDIGNWDMTEVPREGDGFMAADHNLAKVWTVSGPVMWWPDAAGGTAATIVLVWTGKTL